MSSILDALKKSERQRSLGRDLVFRDASRNAAPRLTGFAIAVLVALSILALAIGALLFSLRESGSPAALAPAGIANLPADNGASKSQESGDATVASAPAAPADAARSVDSTAQSAFQTAPALSKPVSPKLDKSVDASRSPVQALPAQGRGAVPWLSSLPQDFRSSLPPLAVNIHVYSPDQSQRILYINNRPVKQGERIEGVVVEEIVHDGVVLLYRGQRFKLPRPS
ncbi:MAG TPA: general secretion pathway protein GspB [Acidiferrobacterales bacterium]|nr:general secretion pathway protein GspB [Acidiferrobacterales bacterium]